MSNLVLASDGVYVDPDIWPHSYTYIGGLLSTDTITVTILNPQIGIPYAGRTYTCTCTCTYTNGILSSISNWVRTA